MYRDTSTVTYVSGEKERGGMYLEQLLLQKATVTATTSARQIQQTDIIQEEVSEVKCLKI